MLNHVVAIVITVRARRAYKELNTYVMADVWVRSLKLIS